MSFGWSVSVSRQKIGGYIIGGMNDPIGGDLVGSSMDRTTTKATEIARVSKKIKKPTWKKTIMTLMSDGSTWERMVVKAPSGKKIKSEWIKFNQVSRTKYTRSMFLRIFSGEGWKVK